MSNVIIAFTLSGITVWMGKINLVCLHIAKKWTTCNLCIMLHTQERLLHCLSKKFVTCVFLLQEMEQLNSFKYDMPEVSEVLTSFFTGSEKQKPRAVKSNKKRQ
jgi:hypothetical protein